MIISLIISITGLIPFAVIGILAANNHHLLVAAWCAIVVAAFADWARHIAGWTRKGAFKQSDRTKTASLRAFSLAFASILAAIYLPDHFQIGEKIKFEAALGWIQAVSDAESRSLHSSGKYSRSPASLDDHIEPLKNFSVTSIEVSTGSVPVWTITLQRKPLFMEYCPIFDCYSVTYTSLSDPNRKEERLPGRFTCSNSECAESLLPQ